MEGFRVARSEDDGCFLVDHSNDLRPHGVDNKIKAPDATPPVPPSLGELEEERAVLRDKSQHFAVHPRQPPGMSKDRLGRNHLAEKI